MVMSAAGTARRRVSTSVLPSIALPNTIVSAAAVAFACATASRRLSLPSVAFTTSAVVVTVNVAIAMRSPRKSLARGHSTAPRPPH